MKQLLSVFLFCSLTFGLFAFEEGNEGYPALLDGNHAYTEGYLQSCLDMNFQNFQVRVKVDGDKAALYSLPEAPLQREGIINFVRRFPGIKEVEVMENTEISREEEGEYRRNLNVMGGAEPVTARNVVGVWFPKTIDLFPTLVADPRQIGCAIGQQFNEGILRNDATAVTLGGEIPVYRWFDVWKWHGDLQISVIGGVWALYNHKEFGDLVNADYYIMIPLIYGFGKWGFRCRLGHISGHVGDEYLLNFPVVRKNPSYEYLDFMASYFLNPQLRAYLGGGVVFQSDESYSYDPLSVEGGIEWRMFGRYLKNKKIFIQPYYGMHVRAWQQFDWTLDRNFVLGCEISKVQNTGRKVRIYLSYHHGLAFMGQFSHLRSDYVGLNLSYGF